MCQISVNFADDPETVDLAAASGCILVLAGIESVDDRVLQGAMNKRINSVKGSAYYREFIAALHRRGIVVLGTMVFGNDEESPDVFDVTARFYRESGLDVPWPGLLTPYPGTALFARLKAESRLLFTDFPADWSKYNQTLVVAPKSGQRDEFLNRLQAFVARNFGLGSVLTRAWRTWRYSRSVLRALLVYNLNRSLARRLRKSIAFIPAPQPRTGC
jgi:hypothetical protein